MNKRKFKKNQTQGPTPLINEELIRLYSQVSVIDSDSKNIGLVNTREAVEMAYEQSLDLMFISKNKEGEPICKMLDYGRYKYDKAQKEKKNHSASTAKKMKEFRFTINIGENDLKMKIQRINGFLEKGYSVRIVVKLRGRELGHKELGFALADKVKELTVDYGKIYDKIETTNNQIFYRLVPNK